MSAFSDYSESIIVNTLLRGQSFTGEAIVYLALFESDPGEDGSGTETSYSGYARQEIILSAFSAGTTNNTNAIDFPANANTSASVTISHAAVYDSLTVGECLIKGALAANKILAPNDVLAFAIQALTLGVD
jgi:hypothetical protein